MVLKFKLDFTLTLLPLMSKVSFSEIKQDIGDKDTVSPLLIFVLSSILLLSLIQFLSFLRNFESFGLQVQLVIDVAKILSIFMMFLFLIIIMFSFIY